MNNSIRMYFTAFAFSICFPSMAWSACDTANKISVSKAIGDCKALCNVNDHQEECSGSTYMSNAAANNDPNGVREGFERCQQNNNDEIGRMQECFREDQTWLLCSARNIYGFSAGPRCGGSCPNPPEQKQVRLQYQSDMHGTAEPRMVEAIFDVEADGALTYISMNLTRDGKRSFKMSTYSVTVVPNEKMTHIKIQTFDHNVKNTAKHKYRVTGEIGFYVKVQCPAQ
jgi:hypothetical protein